MDTTTRQAVKQALDLRDDLLARTVQDNDHLREVNAELLKALKMFMIQYDGEGLERRNRPEIIAARAAIARAEQA